MNILDTYGKRKNGRKEPQMSDESPPSFMRSNQVANPNVPQRQTSLRSERAAQAAQQWEELENELRDTKAKYEIEVNALRAEHEAQRHRLQTEIQELKGRVATLETANNILNTDCETLKLRGEANQSKLDSQRAKLEVAAKIIIDLAREEERAGLTQIQSNETQRAVEQELQ